MRRFMFVVLIVLMMPTNASAITPITWNVKDNVATGQRGATIGIIDEDYVTLVLVIMILNPYEVRVGVYTADILSGSLAELHIWVDDIFWFTDLVHSLRSGVWTIPSTIPLKEKLFVENALLFGRKATVQLKLVTPEMAPVTLDLTGLMSVYHEAMAYVVGVP